MAKRTWKLALLMGAVVAIGAAPAVRADDASELEKIKQENAALKERVDGLESEVGDLKAMVKNLVSLQPPARTTPETPGLTQADVETLKTLARSPRPPVTSSLRAEVYGKIKADAAYDTQRVSTGDYIRWVESERYNSNDNEFNLTANETRLGVKIFGPEDDTLRTSGLVEVDFFASGVPENKAEMFMRHAYLLLEWPNSRFSVLAGQTWDVISPLAPYQGSLNYSVAWWAGNIGYRRPQIRVTKAFGQDVEYKLEAALARTIGRSSGFDPGDTGEDAGFPTVQARASTSFDLFGNKKTTVGVSGHFGEEEFDKDVFNSNRNYQSWSTNLDLSMPLNDWLAIKGEAFVGENLDAYLGGIGQGVDTTLNKEVGSCGGWLMASLTPLEKWMFNLGSSLEDVNQSDISAATGRVYNRSIFANGIYSLNTHASVGLELSHWRTEYKGIDDGDALRVQTSFMYSF